MWIEPVKASGAVTLGKVDADGVLASAFEGAAAVVSAIDVAAELKTRSEVELLPDVDVAADRGAAKAAVLMQTNLVAGEVEEAQVLVEIGIGAKARRVASGGGQGEEEGHEENRGEEDAAGGAPPEGKAQQGPDEEEGQDAKDEVARIVEPGIGEVEAGAAKGDGRDEGQQGPGEAAQVGSLAGLGGGHPSPECNGRELATRRGIS